MSFLLVAGTPAERQSLAQHFLQAGVPVKSTRGLTYEELAAMPPDDIPNYQVIVVAMCSTVQGWEQIAKRLKRIAPQSYLTCAFLGNLPEEHVGVLTKKAQAVGGSLVIIAESTPVRTRETIQGLQQRVAPVPA